MTGMLCEQVGAEAPEGDGKMVDVLSSGSNKTQCGPVGSEQQTNLWASAAGAATVCVTGLAFECVRTGFEARDDWELDV